MTTDLDALLRRGDVDQLVREIDRLCGRGAHDEVLWLRDRCHAAVEDLGRQLWGPARYAEYRLALEAPGPLAATVVAPGAGRFALGPLTEVVAQHHRFEEVADDLDPVVRAVVAQERVLRGEDLRGDRRATVDDVGLPAALEPWEPAYPVPTYRATEVLAPAPTTGGTPLGTVADAAGARLEEHRLTDALLELVAPWRETSPAGTRVAIVAGTAAAAVAALGPGPVVLTRLPLPDAFAVMAWAAASGGARGQRRGGAAGRASAWWVGHAATGLTFPAEADELEFHLEDLTWYSFGERAGGTGWRLRLAVAGDGWAAAIDAHDPDTDADDEDHHAG